MEKSKSLPNDVRAKAPPCRVASYPARLALLFALFFLFSAVSIAFHHHDDGCEHDDCPICAAAFVISTAVVGLGFFLYAVFITASRLEVFEPSSVYDCESLCLPRTRAPPA
ncbi:MAG: hypothetical protein P4L43_03060 [Syntrophobacteraceae bacterium]|nr:hypothetical protein [Syntrophobacteraceae bacterium]